MSAKLFLIFQTHYNYIREKYANKSALLFTDTDSLMYHIRTDHFYSDISLDIKDKFDTSDYPPDHKSGILTGVNKKVIGMFKDEVAGKQITHFVGLRPKLYSFKIENCREVRKCKGIKKNVVKKGINFEDYVKCLFSGEKQMKTMKIIRSENHDIYSKEVNKVALCCDDNKRIILHTTHNTPQQIEEYRAILDDFKRKEENAVSLLRTCVNPYCKQNGPSFFIESGFYLCEECDSCNGKALGYHDKKEYDRFYYRKKSIYQRKYHYENKVRDLPRRLLLTDEEQYRLFSKLMDINEHIISEIYARFNRKRMITVFYIIKKLLQEMGCEKYHQIGLTLSKQTFQSYEKWWKFYKEFDENFQ